MLQRIAFIVLSLFLTIGDESSKLEIAKESLRGLCCYVCFLSDLPVHNSIDATKYLLRDHSDHSRRNLFRHQSVRGRELGPEIVQAKSYVELLTYGPANPELVDKASSGPNI